MIEALIEVLPEIGGRMEEITSLTLRTNPRWLKVCNIPAPQTGLEVKFSYTWLAGMVIEGRNTGAFETYCDDLSRDPALSAFARKVDVIGDETLTDMQAEGEIEFADGRKVPFSHDLARRPAPDALAMKLRAKAEAVLGDGADRIAPILERLSGLNAADLGDIVRGGDDV